MVRPQPLLEVARHRDERSSASRDNILSELVDEGNDCVGTTDMSATYDSESEAHGMPYVSQTDYSTITTRVSLNGWSASPVSLPHHGPVIDVDRSHNTTPSQNQHEKRLHQNDPPQRHSVKRRRLGLSRTAVVMTPPASAPKMPQLNDAVSLLASSVQPGSRILKKGQHHPLSNALCLRRQRRQHVTSTLLSLPSERPPSSMLRQQTYQHSWLLRQVFADESIGVDVVRFLKPSEIRHLIYVLELEGLPVAGYFELLCRLLFSAPDVAALTAEYMGIFGSGGEKEAAPVDEDEVQFLGATFDPCWRLGVHLRETVGVTPDRRIAPFEMIYKAEALGRYCDECALPLAVPQVVPPQLISVAEAAAAAAAAAVRGMTTVPTTTVTPADSNVVFHPIKREPNDDETVPCQQLIDCAGLRVVLCPPCQSRFLTLTDIASDLADIEDGRRLLEQCKVLPSDACRIPFDHAGHVVDAERWKHIVQNFREARAVFFNIVRDQFARRLACRFGQNFYHSFIHKILPPNDFLDYDARTRKQKYVRIKSRSIGGRPSWSRFRDAPAIDRYPLGSLERSTALLLRDVFQQWAQSTNIKELVETEVRMIEKFRLAHDVSKHKDYQRAASVVEDFVLTRKIDRDKFDLLFLPALWRVLHRGVTGVPRTFTACLEDRRRVDKFFAACCQGSPPVLHVKGYLGFSADHNDSCSLQSATMGSDNVGNAEVVCRRSDSPSRSDAIPASEPLCSDPFPSTRPTSPYNNQTALERLRSVLSRKQGQDGTPT